MKTEEWRMKNEEWRMKNDEIRLFTEFNQQEHANFTNSSMNSTLLSIFLLTDNQKSRQIVQYNPETQWTSIN